MKAVSDLFTPSRGEVLEINAALEADPSSVNREPFGGGWLFKVKLTNPGEKSNFCRRRYESLLDRPEGDALAKSTRAASQPKPHCGDARMTKRLYMYTPHTARDIEQMLAVVGVGSLDELAAVPDAVAVTAPLDLVPALPEIEIAARFDRFAEENAGAGYLSFLGAGAYRHYVPPAIGALAMRGEFLTSYTPYQAEVSQGYLQAIYEWQTYIACSPAWTSRTRRCTTARRRWPKARSWRSTRPAARVLVSRAVHPNYRAVLRTYCDGLDVDVDELPYAADGTTDLAALREAVASSDTPRSSCSRRTSSGRRRAAGDGVAARSRRTGRC